ncbi:hypothetical protein ACHAWF_011909 [Thalassiosira exigua]
MALAEVEESTGRKARRAGARASFGRRSPPRGGGARGFEREEDVGDERYEALGMSTRRAPS